MDSEELLNRIKQLIGEGELDSAFRKLEELVKYNDPFYNELIILKNRFTEIEKKDRLGFSKGSGEKNILVYDFLKLIDHLKEQEGIESNHNIEVLIGSQIQEPDTISRKLNKSSDSKRNPNLNKLILKIIGAILVFLFLDYLIWPSDDSSKVQKYQPVADTTQIPLKEKPDLSIDETKKPTPSSRGTIPSQKENKNLLE